MKSFLSPAMTAKLSTKLQSKAVFSREKSQKGEHLSAAGKMSTIFTLYNLYSNISKDDII